MTVSYNAAVSSVSAFTFFRLLLRWRGSIWKSILYELLLWIGLYYVVFVIYRYVLSHEAQGKFERVATYCNENLVYIPLTFMLGFFVSIIVDRWRQTFNNMGWIENLALTLANLLRHDSDEARQMRRDVIRYSVLSQILVFRDVSLRVRRRFPNMESIVNAGFLHDNELKDLEEIKIAYNKYWAPIHWAMNVCVKALKNQYLESPYAMIVVQNEIRAFRTALALLCNFDWVPVPIAYPQVVFLAVRSYFAICLVSRQFVLGEEPMFRGVIDLYVPFMTILEFIFIVGWMKVAEALLNPLGEDDDDFECNFLIDKNIATGLMIVDDQYGACPKLAPDRFADPDFNPIYSEDSQLHGADGVLVGSAEGYHFDDEENVKMVALKPEDIHSHESTPRFLRRLSDALTSRSRSTSEPFHEELEKESADFGHKFSVPNINLEIVSEETSNKSTPTASTVVITDGEDARVNDQAETRNK
ncbi:bestrophin-1 family protein [Ancylostoma caninum]|uniref:Bestrophin homolog n=1 Tax=Ancylostoma caninum TaxID=29170 RepID=A0A368GNR7_ANCCA|nr:bestrophin-1 family protein [Ancylostoma caninum]